MPVKIKSTLGSVTLAAENVSGDTTLTVPSGTDTVATTTQVNRMGGRKNLIINGGMQVAQRGTSFTTIDGYNLDRWRAGTYNGQGGDVDVSQGSFTPATSYPERFGNYVEYTINTMPSSSNPNFHQRIEDVATANGQEVTLSFWAKVTSGTYTMRSYFSNNSGGSGGTTTPVEHSLTTTWTKFTNTSTLPSVTSGTVGSTTFVRTDFDFLNTQSGATIQITGVQLELGDTATDFEHRSYGEELALCQRYFCHSGKGETVPSLTSSPATTLTGATAHDIEDISVTSAPFPVTMRTAPTMSVGKIYTYNWGVSYDITFILASDKGVHRLAHNRTQQVGRPYWFAYIADAEL